MTISADGLRFRLATTDDVPEMHRIRLAVRENRLSNPAAVQPNDYVSRLTARGRGWVAAIDGAIAGFAIADRLQANIWALFVDPQHEGRGIGRRLHDHVVEWLFAAGADRIWLSTEANTRAERFYRAAGWVAVGTQPNGEIRFELTHDRWRSMNRT